MHVDFYLVLASSVVGLLLGITGMGGGALMTPMLVLLFGVAPSAAISADLLATLFIKPWGVLVHWRRHTIQKEIVKFLCVGSLPAAFLGTYVMHRMGHSASAERHLQFFLGLALVLGAGAMIIRSRSAQRLVTTSPPSTTRVLATIGVGAGGGFLVGLTSVGAGSLMLVLLMMLYPSLRSDQLAGTDLAQSVPLTLGASAGTLLFGHVAFALTVSIIAGGVPAVIVGSLLSSRFTGPRIRHVMTGLVFVSGLKYLGVPVVGIGLVGLVILAALTISTRCSRNTRVREVDELPRQSIVSHDANY